MIKQHVNRIGWIDTVKGIGLLCVILGYLSIPLVDTWVCFFHMPLFFFLSGLVFSGGEYDFKTYLTKKLRFRELSPEKYCKTIALQFVTEPKFVQLEDTE